MVQRILVVTGNCQTGGIAAALALMLPNDKIVPFAISRTGDEEGKAALRAHLADADVWITSASKQERAAIAASPVGQVIRLPPVVFSAYHPDIAYVRRVNAVDASAFLKGAHGVSYSSAIAFWAYRQQLSVEATKLLFTREIFERLGYFDRWAADVKALKATFDAAELDFPSFFLRVRGPEPFMHTLNHPKIKVLAEIAKQLAMQLGASRDALNTPFERVLSDGLASTCIWPVYPGIGEAYGTQGAYLWKIGGSTYITSLEEFLSLSFEAYSKFHAADYTTRDIGVHDAVLKQFI